ncbi:hypothetical protein U3516DRAFT_738968 [Neocallimastix sp. 'constans']|jgi:hypothetical protein
MRTNFIYKAFLFTATLFSTSFAKSAPEENPYANTATYIGGPVDGIVDSKNNKCKVDIDGIEQYAIVSEKVFNVKDVCKERYVVALVTSRGDIAEYPMVKARIVEASENCDDTQIILNKDTYDKISNNDEKASIAWAVVDKQGEIELKVNYEAFKELDEAIGIPANIIQDYFEQGAKNMVANDIDAQDYPWDIKKEGGNGFVGTAAVVAAAAGLLAFTGYKLKSKRVEETESSLAIPDLPPLDTTINTISDHPDGLPRVDIYNPPLEFYHFPMDTSYDIVDIRPDHYEKY